MNRYLPFVLLLLVSGLARAHHSTLGFFNPEERSEVEGVLTNITWRNPHIRFTLDVTAADGTTEEWKIEASALSVLKSRGLDQNFMQPGDRIKIYGHPSRHGEPEMWARNVLLPNGTEVLLATRSEAYFTVSTTGEMLDPVFDDQISEAARANADGIFRVWSTVLTDRDSFPMFKGDYPLTAKAAQIKADWNPSSDQLLSCWEKGMPILMITPIPLEITRRDDDIVIRFEEDDTERVIHMNDDSPPEAFSFLGYSRGSWEGDILVIETTNINAPEFDDRGTPQTDNIQTTERLTLSEDEQRLNYSIAFTDSETFTEPFELSRYFIWRPEIAIGEWDCENQMDRI
ncbi:MAG: DUF6152 family protein [Arenicellaceae bacterium]|nr:DUF6152 family protein [Arenicellaceae bacterium]